MMQQKLWKFIVNVLLDQAESANTMSAFTPCSLKRIIVNFNIDDIHSIASLACITRFFFTLFSIVYMRAERAPMLFYTVPYGKADKSRRLQTLCITWGTDHHQGDNPCFNLQVLQLFKAYIKHARARGFNLIGTVFDVNYSELGVEIKGFLKRLNY